LVTPLPRATIPPSYDLIWNDLSRETQRSPHDFFCLFYLFRFVVFLLHRGLFIY
jgi:hypothetical protein